MIERGKIFVALFVLFGAVLSGIGTLAQAVVSGQQGGFLAAVPWLLSCAASGALFVTVVGACLDSAEPKP